MRQAGSMSSEQPGSFQLPWSSPETAAPGGLGSAGPEAATTVQFGSGGPLGGSAPVPVDVPERSSRRELILVAVLLVVAVVAGAASLLSWRDFGRRFGATAVETGWERIDGTMGRGWVAVALATLLAVAGVLIASGRGRPGRILATWTGVVMCFAAVAEWGLGADATRTGPGIGLWIQLVLGVLVVLAVGILGSDGVPEPSWVPDA